MHDVLTSLNAGGAGGAAEDQFQMIPSSLFIHSDLLLDGDSEAFLFVCVAITLKEKLSLGARRVNGQVRIDVWDNGTGIDEDKQQEIFEEFTRGSQVRADQGLGLGWRYRRRPYIVVITSRCVHGREGSVFFHHLSEQTGGSNYCKLAPMATSDIGTLAPLCRQ